MFPPAVEDWVGADHPARFLREVVDEMDLEGLGFRQSEGKQGRPHYGSGLLLKVWLWGYMNRIRSSRQLERACREQVSLIWLLGRAEPDHNTLWRFWRGNQAAIRKLFGEVVRVAVRAEVVGLVLHALDGTKIRSVASTERAYHRKTLERDLQQLDEWIDEVEREIEENERREQGSYRLPKELEDRRELRRRIQGALEELQREKQGSWNRGDPQARMMPCEGKKHLAYNAQAVVDEQSGMIVAEAVVNEANDLQQLAGMLQETQENLGQTAADTVADKGYRSERNLHEAAEAGHSVLVNLYETEGEEASAYHISRFEYEAHRQLCRCPRGVELKLEGTKKSRHHGGQMETSFRCGLGTNCPVASDCTKDPVGRKVTFGPYQQAIARQRQRHREPGARAKLARRKAIVERAFAEIKETERFRRWTFRGQMKVQTQWSMICTAFNLKRLLRYWRNGQLVLLR